MFSCDDCLDFRKVVIIGCGLVGAATAFCLMQSGLFSEMVLLDSDFNKAEGEALDISHGLPFAKHMNIYAGTYDDIVNASLIIIAAGANQRDGETRLDLVKRNINIFKNIIPEITKRNIKGIILVVSNPVDILTTVTLKLGNFDSKRVFGSGTVLDSARLKYEIGKCFDIDSRSVHAYIIGEHGDTEIPVWSSARISGICLKDFCHIAKNKELEDIEVKIAEDVRNSAYEIIKRKKATYFGIAMSVKRICEAIVRDEKSILPISSMLNGEYGIEGIALSTPAIVGKNGIEGRIPINLNEEELKDLQNSAQNLKNILYDNFNT